MDRRIKRIEEMEDYLDKSRKAVDDLTKAFDEYEKIQRGYKKLLSYYDSKHWLEDFEADAEGLLPKDLKRGVLSEDAVYDLISDNHELSVRMLKVMSKALENDTI